MLSIEHEFEATVVTLVDEGPEPLQEDVTVAAFDDRVTFTQYDVEGDRVMQVTMSPLQVQELLAALDLPEGVYRRAGADADP
ncbi:MAG: hypothetical protein H3C51_08650 [Rubellimicrobium sp.]|nr:hypothetical protein [Rubellimicrobium sp.]